MNTDSPNIETKDRSGTTMILEKFTKEDGEVDVNKIAHKMNVVNKQNITYKKILLLGALFLVVAVGLMIASNIIGGLTLKDMKVKDDQLVSKSNTPIQTGLKLYNMQVTLFTKPDVLNGLQYVYVPVVVDGLNSTLNLKINSYIYSEGNSIIFLGDKYTLVLKRTSYDIVATSSFDPLDLSTTETAKRIFSSEESDFVHKNVHPPNRESSKRDDDFELAYTIATLDARGTVANPHVARAASTVNLGYYGGPVVKEGNVIIIVWNDMTNGNLRATNISACFNNLPTFYNDLIKTKLFSQYTPGFKGSDPQARVSNIDEKIYYLNPDSAYKKQSLSDTDIKNQMGSWISKSAVPKDTSNPLRYMYMIHFPSGIKLSSGFCNKYCGFHSTVTTGNVKYIYSALPWNGDCPGGCTKSTYVSSIGGVNCGSHQSVASHELTEMATDPYFNAYYDTNGYENADKCAWTSPGCFSSGSNSYCVQQAWNRAQYNGKDIGCTNKYQ
jgi:hypothetical protein